MEKIWRVTEQCYSSPFLFLVGSNEHPQQPTVIAGKSASVKH